MKTIPQRKFGVEIECFVPYNADGTSRSLIEIASAVTAAGVPCTFEGYNHALRNHWKIVTDASLQNTGDRRGVPMEFVSPILEGSNGLEQIKTVCSVLAGYSAYTNRTCGLHVHVDARGEAVSFFRNIVLLYSQYEPVIDQAMPPSRRGNSAHYCCTVSRAQQREVIAASSVEALSRIVHRSSGASHDRYHKLNLTSFWRHGTVEFRHHSGTVEAEKIINWVLFCLRLAQTAKEKETNTLLGGNPVINARASTILYKVAEMVMREGGATRSELEVAIGKRLPSIPSFVKKAGLEVDVQRRGNDPRYTVRRGSVRPITLMALAELAGLDEEELTYWTARVAQFANQSLAA